MFDPNESQSDDTSGEVDTTTISEGNNDSYFWDQEQLSDYANQGSHDDYYDSNDSSDEE